MSRLNINSSTEQLKVIPRIKYCLYHVYYEVRKFAPSSYKFLYNYNLSNFVCYLDTHYYLIVMRTCASRYLVLIRDKVHKFKTKNEVIDFLYHQLDCLLNEYQYTLDSINKIIK